MGTW
jgi:hypothetical protein